MITPPSSQSSPDPTHPAQRARDFADLVHLGRQSNSKEAPWVTLSVGPDVSKAFNYARALLLCGLRVLPLDGVGGLQASPCTEETPLARGLVLTGGGDIDPQLLGQPVVAPHTLGGILPQRDQHERTWFLEAWESRTPILAICRGMQLMNWCLGGTLWLDLDSELPNPGKPAPPGGYGHRQVDRGLPKSAVGHTLRILPESLLARYYGTTQVGVNSDHHQAVREVAPPLRVTAWADDEVIEGVEARDRFALGVQFHPELMWRDSPEHLAVFQALADAVQQQ